MIVVPLFYRNTNNLNRRDLNSEIKEKVLIEGQDLNLPDHYIIKMTVPEVNEENITRNKIDTSVIGSNPLEWAYTNLKEIIRKENPKILEIFDI